MPAETILIAVPDDGVRDSLTHALASAGRVVLEAARAQHVIERAVRHAPDVVVLSLYGYESGIDGFELIEILRRGGCDAEVIAVADVSGREVDTLVAARRARVQEVLWTPLDAGHARQCVNRALKARRVRRQSGALVDRSDLDIGSRLIGMSRPMLDLKRQIAACATSDINVLLEGETGVGKEVVARTIHDQSKRSGGAFVAVNCGAVPEHLIESELFGHRKGAFTGAVAHRTGSFGRADGGTIFLDEIGDAPAQVQVKLLRVLQERTFMPVGGEAEVRTTARVIAATNRDLRERVRKGRFREDLLHRLDVARIRIPPLRERMEDIEALAEYLVMRAADELYVDAAPIVSAEALDAIRRHTWPGNVRELEHVLARAVAGTAVRGVILADDLTLDAEPPSESGGASEEGSRGELGDDPARWVGPDGRFLTYEEGQILHIRAALRRCGGNIAEVARQLDLPRSTLRHRMSKLGIGGGG